MGLETRMPFQDLVLGNGSLELTGYPEGYRAVKLNTEYEKRMSRLRVGQTLANQALNILEAAQNRFDLDDQLIWTAIVNAASGLYFACFSQSALGPHLNSKAVFRGNEVATAWHIRWKEIRDKHIHHPGDVGRSIETGTIIDGNENFVELVTIKMSVRVGIDQESIGSLILLLKMTLTHLTNLADAVNGSAQKNFCELEKEKICNAERFLINKPVR